MEALADRTLAARLRSGRKVGSCLSNNRSLHVYVQAEKWEVVDRIIIDGKMSETDCAIILHELSLEIEVRTGICEVDSDYTRGLEIGG